MDIKLSCQGYGDLEYFPSKPLVVISGSEDGQVFCTDLERNAKAAANEEDDRTTEPSSSKLLDCDGMISALKLSADEQSLLVCHDAEGTVYQYQVSTGALERIVYRSTLEILCLDCSREYIAIGGEDPVSRILTVKDAQVVSTCEGHERDVKAIAISACETSVASASKDGTIKIFDLRSGQVQYSIVAVDRDQRLNDDVKSQMAWSTMSNMPVLALPTRHRIEVLMNSRSDGAERKNQSNSCSTTWTRLTSSSSASDDDGHEKHISIVTFSPCGHYIMSSCIAHEIRLWKLNVLDKKNVTLTLLATAFRSDDLVTNLKWTANNVLMWYQINGICHYEHFEPSMMMTTTTAAAAAAAASASRNTHVPAITPVGTGNESTTDAGQSGVHVQSNHLTTTMKALGEEDLDQEDLDQEDLDQEDLEEQKTNSLTSIKNQFGFRSSDTSPASVTTKDRSSGLLSRQPPVSVQKPFQPGSCANDGVTLLAWTPLGDIESIRGRDYNLIKIDFANRSRRLIKFNDQFFFTKAALGLHGAIFASPARGQDSDLEDLPSFLFYRAFDAWTKDKCWQVALPPHEDIEVVALGSGWCSSISSLNILRFHTLGSGLLFSELHLAIHSVVSMTGHGSMLCVISASSDSTLTYHIYHVNNERLVTRVDTGAFPLSKERRTRSSISVPSSSFSSLSSSSELSWIGFSGSSESESQSSQAPCLFSCDSNDLFQMYCPKARAWTPVMLPNVSTNARKWCVGVVMDQLLYFNLLPGTLEPSLRGKQRPIPSTVSLKPKLGSERSLVWIQAQVQALMDTTSHASSPHFTEAAAEQDKQVLQWIKQVCQQDQQARALDLVQSLVLEKSFEIAMKVSSHFQLHELTDRIQTLEQDRFRHQDVYPSESEEEELSGDEEQERHDGHREQTRSGLSDNKYDEEDMPLYPNQEQQENVPPMSSSSLARTFQHQTTLDSSSLTASTNANIKSSANPFAVKKRLTSQKRKSIPQVFEALRSPLKKKST